MRVPSLVRFGDEKLKEAYDQLPSGAGCDIELKQLLDRAFIDLRDNAFCGIQIKKKLIPKEYIKKYGKLDNLWKYNLPNAWRLIYTIKRDIVFVLSVVLEWMNHKEYENRFKY